ncbi:DUF2793 domain-containing protein [Sphingomonas sp. HMP6]|uniref:DUF2793 domain-containing protein n=1 Tax=Sphingomonas sp. HMP6 TaxID=1517551 RepID=UPI00159663BE|nr:DUF2793 domain-containing protein [Sphingomonas sp. HMP6]BCA59592.1 hypothetical protein HMP06_2361 [Sphingomonas sp. HMP6]
MSDETSVRLGLPLLQTGQAQKEMTYNEALTLLDFAVQPVVEAVGVDTPPAAPAPGACWVVGPTPNGAWTGQANAIAGWSAGGWRFIGADDGMAAWSRADDAIARFSGGEWTVGRLSGTQVVVAATKVVGTQQSAISTPSGGSAPDTEARIAITAILAALRTHGLIAT